jgi:hypothetical protein
MLPARERSPTKITINTSPSALIGAAQGPTTDFVVGRIYESAKDGAMEKISMFDVMKVRPSEEWPSAAQNEFTAQNCGLL